MITLTPKSTFGERADKLQAVIEQTPGVTVKRSEIARRLGKKQLNPSDVAALDYLAEAGRIEQVKVEDSTPIGYRFEYKALP